MKKASLPLVAIALIASQAAMAGNTSTNTSIPPGSGVQTDASGAMVRPGFHNPGTDTVVKAGAAASTFCQDPAGYRRVKFIRYDVWGSFFIKRPADAVGEVRYCVAAQAPGTQSLDVKYDVLGQ